MERLRLGIVGCGNISTRYLANVSISVADLDKSTKFYQALGFESGDVHALPFDADEAEPTSLGTLHVLADMANPARVHGIVGQGALL